MSNLKGAPKEVLLVHEALLKNAEKAYGPNAETFVYTRPEAQWAGNIPHSGRWLVGSNMEDGSPTLVYDPTNGKWWYREWMSEHPDKEYDLERALSDASIMWTG